MVEGDRMKCPDCGALMNHHADKLDYGADGEEFDAEPGGGVLIEAHACPDCGRAATRTAPEAWGE
jgi:ribosomal protein S27AE